MPYKNRIQYAGFVDNQREIESKWDLHFGDRHNELVLIGQEMQKDDIIKELQQCLCTDREIAAMDRGQLFKDPFTF